MSKIRILTSSIEQPQITIPGSKYLANRYVILAALCKGITRLDNVPLNDDILAALDAVQSLGARIEISGNSVAITGIEDYSPVKPININCKDSGTLSRFVTALAANLSAEVTIDASDQMRQRPMQEIIETLQRLDVSVDSQNGYLPIQLKGPIVGGTCALDASRSSQFLSALLIACLHAKKDTLIQLQSDAVSESYVELTLKAIKLFAGDVKRINQREFLIESDQSLKAANIYVASDVVSSSYFMAAALIAKTSITIKNYDFNSVQGESGFPSVLALMGAEIEQKEQDLLVSYEKSLKGITVDMGNMPDAVPTLAVIAAFAAGTTQITNIAHLAYKESNRIVDLCEQLKRVGVDCDYDADSITIHGQAPLSAASVSSCHDHRLAMSLALIGIEVPNIVIEDAHAVEKSFPQYWQYLEQIGIVSEEI